MGKSRIAISWLWLLPSGLESLTRSPRGVSSARISMGLYPPLYHPYLSLWTLLFFGETSISSPADISVSDTPGEVREVQGISQAGSPTLALSGAGYALTANGLVLSLPRKYTVRCA